MTENGQFSGILINSFLHIFIIASFQGLHIYFSFASGELRVKPHKMHFIGQDQPVGSKNIYGKIPGVKCAYPQ